MRKSLLLGALLIAGAVSAFSQEPADDPANSQIIQAFGKQGIRISSTEAGKIRDNVRLALREARDHGIGNSKVDFAAVEIATDLGLDTSPGSSSVNNVVAAIRYLLEHPEPRITRPPEPPSPPIEWENYFEGTVGLANRSDFMSLVNERGFHPVKISWEDIGRYQNSSWGDRISDVGIWVRKVESDPSSARLALSVRRDSNFRDKVLLVPADRIKIHQFIDGRAVEKTLPQRLRELGLASRTRDKNVIVSNQFAIVPVPARWMRGAWPEGVPPRAAFTFSIFPYGSTNFVITDVIEGSHEAVVGPGSHQLLFANVDGGKAPFTASRAADRRDLLQLEQELKAKGMDVDVQRYYLIQIPLSRDAARRIRSSNMGTPPFRMAQAMPAPMGALVGVAPTSAPPPPTASEATMQAPKAVRREGLTRVAIGHGETEGPYSTGSGWRGARAEEPIRVTVVYFVTPVGAITRKDMSNFAAAFAQWDSQAIWGGSFVTKNSY